jgi:pimeloyl-ACP methyl ester carboxylesterase
MASRRDALKMAAAAGVAASHNLQTASAQTAGSTFVLVHGAWSGGYIWRRVADRLRKNGHTVFTPTNTGLADRAHLLSKNITIDTFFKDVTGVFEAEELSNVILVGHSFGGNTITGVADVIPEKIQHLVYLDSLLPQPGKSVLDALPPEVAAERRKISQETSGGLSLPGAPAELLRTSMGLSDDADLAWLVRRGTPHPMGTYESPVILKNPIGNNLPRTYIACTNPVLAVTMGSKRWVQSQQGWGWLEIATGHVAQVTAPAELTGMLEKIAAS